MTPRLLIVGPCEGWRSDLKKVPGYDEVMVVNYAHNFWPNPDFWVSKHTETFSESTAWRISGDTWINEFVDEHIELSNSGNSGPYSVRLGLSMGFDEIYVIGMRGTYDLPNDGYDALLNLPMCDLTDDSIAEQWNNVDLHKVTFINWQGAKLINGNIAR